MRKLTHFDDESRARLLSDALYARDIDNELRAEASGGHTLWVLDEQEVDDARAMLARFDADPDDPEIRRAASEARERRKAAAHEARKSRHKVINARTTLGRSNARGPVTSSLIAISVVVMALTALHSETLWRSTLSIAALRFEGNHVSWLPGFAEVRAGQVWRLVTPIFLHGDLLHLLFNMWWLLDFGAVLEQRMGSWRLLGLVLLSAAASNAAQFEWGGSPLFGGMSGVVYALFGYLWLRGDHDPSFGVAVRRQLVGFFMIWWALGVFGVLDRLIGPVANYCHSGGLAVGAAWGYLASRHSPRPRLP